MIYFDILLYLDRLNRFLSELEKPEVKKLEKNKVL
jgi:hypothetical protein